ncbi:GAF domain-containing sensor histidine kinase [Anabaena sp. FACHB-1237]|uniref:GAF domain-containing sensor histidine kinase n=1 Tax=Anabaena sp. FACHB-1237 TaxID=2692769 RepID=UPI001681A9D2|nr:GAF domain-containing sensor histidine kinase [Anabaena sp. FACHB-1237]MBD2138246.1 GAF domain-containing sensor histidine kinase [Anabaena sp. FACHB-1237]
MFISPDLGFSHTVPVSIFDQLGELLQQMATLVITDAVVLTDALLAPVFSPRDWQDKRFILVISHGFTALLLGKIPPSQQDNLYVNLDVNFTFNLQAINSFISELAELFTTNSLTCQKLHQYSEVIGNHDANLQSEFTLLLLEYLLKQPEITISQKTHTVDNTNTNFTCQIVEDILKKQIAQEQLLNHVTSQIRKSLDLSVIINTAISQVREFLKLDRLVIYKFVPAKIIVESVEISDNSFDDKDNSYVIYESLGSEIPSVLNIQQESCFFPLPYCYDKYLQNFTLVVDDIEKTYILETCLLEFLRNIQVRAKCAIPIIFENKLWGLLIAHQCYIPRQWHQGDIKLLTSIAEQLAIAIYQTELMTSLKVATEILKQEKETLEQRVIERTMALREALLAAEAASRVRSEFLATISHELLTPLTYVIGMSSTLLKWPLGELSQRQRNYLQTIHDSGEHLLEMINDILDLSQIQAGKTVLNIERFSLIKVAQNSLSCVKDKAKEKNITLELDLQINPTQDEFTGDATRMEQIIWNLLTNAIKFTPENGTVILRLWIEDNTAIWQVEDTGIGIPEDKLTLLFEKFQQLDTPYRRNYQGTGLGLALTKQLVELHRGRIEVESTVGIGSVFTVWIPNQVKNG